MSLKAVDYSIEREQELFDVLFPMLSEVHDIKGKSYGKSWRKRGHFSALMNVLRKLDRLENLILDKGVSDIGGGSENIINTVMDLATYSNMWLGLLSQSYPEETLKAFQNEGVSSEKLMALRRLLDHKEE